MGTEQKWFKGVNESLYPAVQVVGTIGEALWERTKKTREIYMHNLLHNLRLRKSGFMYRRRPQIA